MECGRTTAQKERPRGIEKLQRTRWLPSLTHASFEYARMHGLTTSGSTTPSMMTSAEPLMPKASVRRCMSQTTYTFVPTRAVGGGGASPQSPPSGTGDPFHSLVRANV